MNEIVFSAHKDYKDLQLDYPQPSKFFLPEWYKKLKHDQRKRTVKGCIPFMETMTSGYTLKLPMDYNLIFNKKGQDNKLYSCVVTAAEFEGYLEKHQDKDTNLVSASRHNSLQIEGSSYYEKMKGLDVPKIMNPWIINTPKGYSCLFLPPLNNPAQDYFSIVPGIVNTDKFDQHINFPIIYNSDKYSEIDKIIKRGTPYVQVIPFKRESWKMTIKTKQKNSNYMWPLQFLNNYKDRIWNKIKWI